MKYEITFDGDPIGTNRDIEDAVVNAVEGFYGSKVRERKVRRWVETITACVVGCLITVAVLLPSVAHVAEERDDWRARFESIERRCRQDGYGRGSGVCPDGTFTPPTTVAAK